MKIYNRKNRYFRDHSTDDQASIGGYMKIGALAFLALSCMICEPAISSSQSGKITNIITMDNGVVIVEMTGARVGPVPSCGTYFQTRWALNGSTAAGQVKVAGLLTAFGLKNTIVVVGKNTCSSWGDTEDVEYFNSILS